MATTINAGRVRFVSRGTYNNSTQYYLFDLVDYNGSSYIAKENTLGNLPTNTQYWQLIAEKGNTGSTGQTGPVGPTGNGIASITKTGTSGLVDTYTITYTNGNTTTFTVTNGEDANIKANYYNKTETDTKLDTKANISDVYNKTETDTKINTKVNSAISSIEIGGRNLLTESSLLSAPSENANFHISFAGIVTSNTYTDEGYKIVAPENAPGTSGFNIELPNANNLIKAGEVVTFSIDIKGKAEFALVRGYFQADGYSTWDNLIIIISSTATTSEDWIRYSGSFVMPDVGTKDTRLLINIGQGSMNGPVTTRIYKNAKLERGNKATDWTPAPEDMNNTYSTNEVKIGTFDGKALYRRCYIGTPTLTAKKWVYLDISSWGIGSVINVQGTAKVTMINGLTLVQNIPRVAPDNITGYGIGFGDISNDTLGILFGTGYTSIKKLILVIEYTKETIL